VTTVLTTFWAQPGDTGCDCGLRPERVGGHETFHATYSPRSRRSLQPGDATRAAPRTTFRTERE
jgi:hypothetical protein